MEKYKAISCSFVDYIEHFATLKSNVFIDYLNANGRSNYIIDRIIDWKHTEGVEYVILKSGIQIRMDYLKSVGGEVLLSAC